jgi:formate/nitrite transporter FocA (FNT family)
MTEASDRRDKQAGHGGTKHDRTPDARRFGHREKAEIENKTPITPPAVFEVVRRAGEQELVRPATALVCSALVAGLAIGFSVLTKALLQTHLPDTDWRPLVTSLGYSVGFVIVIMGQMQLFTENTITVVCPLLVRPSLAVLGGVARLWSLVLGANLAGAATFGAALYLAREVQPQTWQAVLELSRYSISHDFWATCIRGIGAGWLIAALVWIIATADRAQLPLIVLVTYVISLAGFSHVVAGGVEAAVLVVAGEMGAADAALGFVAPAVIGNVIGGTVLFTLLTWAQIRAEL